MNLNAHQGEGYLSEQFLAYIKKKRSSYVSEFTKAIKKIESYLNKTNFQKQEVTTII